MPEPPIAFDLSGVNQGAIAVNIPADPRVLVIEALTGNVPSGSVVRVTNLDTTDPVVAGARIAQGGFDVELIVTDGQELRFEWVNAGEHSAPADAIVSRADPMSQTFALSAAPRFDCLKLSPGFALDFGTTAQATLSLQNGCSQAVSVSNPRTRLGLADFAVSTTLPIDVAAGSSTELTVDFTRSAQGPREDVLFVDVTSAGSTIRYPITLRTE
jgi:hypothetical protein